MFGNDRSVIAALIGCLGLAAAAVSQSDDTQRGHYQSYRYAADKSVEINPSTTKLPGAAMLEDRHPCERPKGRDESALCAERRSAEAAENSAFWAACGFWLSVVGSAFLIWQVALTRKAVEETSAATDAAREANQIARHNAELEMRPIIVFDGLLIESFGNGNIFVIPVWKNIGKLPALPILSISQRIYIDNVPDDSDVQELLADAPHYAADASIIPTEATRAGGVKLIGPDRIERLDSWPPNHQPSPEMIALWNQNGIPRYRSKRKAFMAYTIQYKAAIGGLTTWETRQLECVVPRWLSDGRMDQTGIDTLVLKHLETFKMS